MVSWRLLKMALTLTPTWHTHLAALDAAEQHYQNVMHGHWLPGSDRFRASPCSSARRKCSPALTLSPAIITAFSL